MDTSQEVEFLKSDLDDIKIVLNNNQTPQTNAGSLMNDSQTQSKDERILQLELQLQEKVMKPSHRYYYLCLSTFISIHFHFILFYFILFCFLKE
jgi:hypothetical protein